MIGRQNRDQMTLFIPGSIDQIIPDDHILKRVDRAFDLSWLIEEVRDCYCEDNGRPAIDPEAALRLMLAGFFHGIIHDRKLMREAQVNIAIRWFAGYDLNDKLPDHSSLTNIRKRWGAARFKKIFQKIVKACVDAGLVSGETVHTDATLIRADVSWESLTTTHADATLAANPGEDEGDSKCVSSKSEYPSNKHNRLKKRSSTDPDATMATSQSNYRLEPSYKQHTAVDDQAGIVVDVELTTGEVNEGTKLIDIVESVEEVTGKKVECVTGDTGYAHPKNYQALEDRGTQAIIPPQRMGRVRNSVPLSRFKYDARHDIVRCPAGKKMHRSSRAKKGWVYRGEARECGACSLRKLCVPKSAKVRTVLIVEGYPSLLRARRHRAWWDEATRGIYRRHRWRVEGAHAEAKVQHGLRRAIRRGLDNVAIQVYLTAAVMNLKRLAAALGPYLSFFRSVISKLTGFWLNIRLKFDTKISEGKTEPEIAMAA